MSARFSILSPQKSRICTQCLRRLRSSTPTSARYLATAAATTPAADPYQIVHSSPPIARYPLTQPPSHRPPEFRKSQLHRQYTSLLRSTPLIILFQHFNLTSREWTGLRRELTIALNRCDQERGTSLSSGIKFQAIQSGIFESALRVAEYYTPELPSSTTTQPSPPISTTGSSVPNIAPNDPSNPSLTHSLSRQAHAAVLHMKNKHPLTPLLHGPIAMLTFTTLSPPHLKTALSILAPEKPLFPAPKRRAMPGYYDPPVQSAVQKVMLLGARVEGKVFDYTQVRWVGGLEGMDWLRAQLVQLLGAAPAQLVSNLQASGVSVWAAMEGRRGMLEEEEKGTGEGKRTQESKEG